MSRGHNKGKLVDDYFASDVIFDIARVGDARYTMRITDEKSSCVIALWTTNKSRIHVELLSSDDSAAITLLMDNEGVLERCSAEYVDVHLENMDRHLYFLGIYSKQDEVKMWLRADKYIQARFIDSQSDKQEGQFPPA